jgi:hypothetical protein
LFKQKKEENFGNLNIFRLKRKKRYVKPIGIFFTVAMS